MIIWLASFPRSGNTMFRMALHHLFGIRTYSVYADDDLKRMGADEVVGHVRHRIDVEKLAMSNEIHFVKTHGKPPAPRSQFKAIHIVRDGRDALTSYAHYRVRVDSLHIGGQLATPQQSMDDLLGLSAHIWGGWSGHARKWIDWKGHHVLVKYEDMVNDVESVVRNALLSLDMPRLVLSDHVGEMPEFGGLSAKWPQFFRKGKIGSWKEFMIDDQLDMFWYRHGNMMEELGYV